jgi:hypothetical protein
MKTFRVEISETSARVISIKAKDADDAWIKARDMYTSEEIVLDSSDFVDYDIAIL